MTNELFLHLPGEAATAAFAGRLAARLRPGDVVALHGDLGAGKTALVRAAVRALAGDEDAEVPSPTFTLVQTYDAGGLWIRHFDLYRLTQPEEAVELGWDEDLAQSVTFVEWPERLGALLPIARLDLTLSIAGEGRDLRAAGGAGWDGRLAGLDRP
jgi:tRNA threonylcarbamoyladenosine biosynthesis protein TsaE